jgi:Mn2+/Fe2+ NRAMP family transporter
MLHPAKPGSESLANYFYYAIALFGAGLMPYEVFFFSSGAIEQHWTKHDLPMMRTNVFIGFPIGAAVTLSIMLGASLVLGPRQIDVGNLYQAALPTAITLGKWALIVVLLGFFACTFGAALETTLACGYSIAQYFGWQWGKFVSAKDDARFHLSLILTVVASVALLLSRADPVKLTEFVIVLSAAALPLTYFPVLVVANDPQYMGDKTNSPFSNALGFAFLVLLLVISVAALPLMIITKAGA